MISECYGGRVAVIGQRFADYPGLRGAPDALPGWGPVTIQLLLRELRGVWPGAQPPLDPRAVLGARHLGLLPGKDPPGHGIDRLGQLAAEGGLDLRDLESGLVQLVLAHHHRMASCPGGRTCHVLGPGSRPE